MTRTAKVTYIAQIENLTNEQIREVMTTRAVALQLDSHNWSAQYPYAPKVTAFVAVSDNHIALMFNILEEHTKAVEMENNGRVWEDSCVEFFVANPVGEGYYNFEMNAIGTLLAAYRTSRENATHFSAEQIAEIRRFGLLDHAPIDVEGETVTETETYTYYPNGNKKSVTDMTGKLIQYTYDNAGRLTAETVDDAVTSYTYDSYNNRIGKTENGILTSYLYDNRNRLTRESFTKNGQTTVTSYQYDPNGNLYSKQTLTYGDNTIQTPEVSAVCQGDGSVDTY